MGRKPKPRQDQKPHQITVRLSDAEQAAIKEALAAIEKRSGLPVQLADWVRRAIREQLKREGRS